MDAVITYVNGNDPVWLKDYRTYVSQDITEKRFRDWGTLHFLFRGIETFMPFIDHVFLVVSHESQVPSWVNREQVRVVLHKDFVPQEYLPTFNCNTLEMHLHRIAGLSEEYLYFNDDIFPVAPCKATDFFRDDKIVLHFSLHRWASGMYKQICRNSDRWAKRILSLPQTSSFVRPQHVCSPMHKSVCEKVYSQVGTEAVRNSSSLIRTEKNGNQYLFSDYLFYQGEVIDERISCKHISIALASSKSLQKHITQPGRNLVCINDVKVSAKRYEKLRAVILAAFEKHLPHKSKFEL